jgi:hypothetical protein
MKEFTTCIQKYLDNEELRYTTHELQHGDAILVGFSREDGSTVDVMIINHEDQAPTLVVFDLIRVPANKLGAVLIQANDDNSRRFFRFNINDNQDLQIRYDMPNGLTPETLMPCMEEMFPLFMSAVYSYYANYARLIYSNSDSDESAV